MFLQFPGGSVGDPRATLKARTVNRSKHTATEQSNLEFRGEFLNAFNRVNFNGTSCASTSQTCGQVSGQQGGPRVIQLVMRINF